MTDTKHVSTLPPLAAEIDRLRAENARLHGALTRILITLLEATNQASRAVAAHTEGRA